MKLLINFASKLGVDSISRLIGFLTLPVITRALGPDGYGMFSYLFVILWYFGFFVDFGYLNYGTNKLCEKIDAATVVGNIVSLQIFVLIFTYLVLITVSYFIFDIEKYFLLLIFSVLFIAQVFSIKYYYLANHKLYYNSISELAGQITYAALVFTVFIQYPSVLTLVILSVVQTSVTSIFLFAPFIRKNKITIHLNLKSNLKTLKEAYKLGLAAKAESITASFIILCIGIFLTEESVGLYNASYKIYLIMLTVVQGISYTFMPMLLRNVKDPNKNNMKRISLIFYVFLLTGLILFIVSFLFSNMIISVMFGDKFFDAVEILKDFSVTILIWPIVMFTGLVILAYNKYNYFLMTSVSSTVFSIVFSLLLINVLKLEGAGLVLPFVAVCTIAVSYYFLKKISDEEQFSLNEIFSLRHALEEFQIMLKPKST